MKFTTIPFLCIVLLLVINSVSAGSKYDEAMKKVEKILSAMENSSSVTSKDQKTLKEYKEKAESSQSESDAKRAKDQAKFYAARYGLKYRD